MLDILTDTGKIAAIEVVYAHGIDFDTFPRQIRRELSKSGKATIAVCDKADVGLGVVQKE